MSAVHLALVDPCLVEGLLSGRKRVESRFAQQRRVPYGRVSPGDKIHFKVTGGDIIGHARAARVQTFSDLTPAAIESLRARYDRVILAPEAYWQARRYCRYGVLIWLRVFTRSVPRLSVPRQYGSGWVVLPARGHN